MLDKGRGSVNSEIRPPGRPSGRFLVSGTHTPETQRHLLECKKETFDPTMVRIDLRLKFDNSSPLRPELDGDVTGDGMLRGIEVFSFYKDWIKAGHRLAAGETRDETIPVASTSEFTYRLSFSRRDDRVVVRLFQGPRSTRGVARLLAETEDTFGDFLQNCCYLPLSHLEGMKLLNASISDTSAFVEIRDLVHDLRRLVGD